MESLKTESEAMIAPQEMKELLTRLTESQLEGVKVDEPRTLAGLALETGVPLDQLRKNLEDLRTGPRKKTRRIVGFVAVALTLSVGFAFLFQPFQPAEAVIPANVPPSFSAVSTDGLLPLNRVTYGPDAGSIWVDPKFEPSAPVQSGISISAQVGNVLWGVGDSRSALITKSLDEKSLAQLKLQLRELLRYVRNHAGERVSTNAHTYSVGIDIRLGEGDSQTVITLPFPDHQYDKDADWLIKKASEDMATQLQDSLRYREGIQRNAGP